MVRALFSIGLCVWAISGSAQKDTSYRYTSTLKFFGTIAPGYLLNVTQTNIYLSGGLEYFPEERLSLRGDGFWMTGAQQKPSLLKDNSTLLFGALYHFHKGRLDFFVGLQPGVNFTKPDSTHDTYLVNLQQTTIQASGTTQYNYKVLPVISPVTGVTFYFSRYFNFFLELRYINTRYFGYQNGNILKLDELRISAGLGFHFHVKKT